MRIQQHRLEADYFIPLSVFREATPGGVEYERLREILGRVERHVPATASIGDMRNARPEEKSRSPQ